MANKQQDFLGKGMKFPPEVNRATGRIVVSEGEKSVKESVYLILMTALTERPLRPDFGTSLMGFTFMDVNLTTQSIMIQTLRDQLLTQEPRITDLQINLDTTSREGVILFNIDYALNPGYTRDSLVFPFYLNNDVEEERDEPENYEPQPVEEITY